MTNVIPQVFKGIALFTPGGDLIYGIDPSKQTQWHIHLCQGLQETMGLADSPHFLVPGYTATVERWLDPQTQRLKIIAEVYPAVQRYIPLLQVLFELETDINWQTVPWQEEYCNHEVIETYRSHFPQLWTRQNLLIRYDPTYLDSLTLEQHRLADRVSKPKTTELLEGCLLRLFISGDCLGAEETLSNIHQLLEEGLTTAYTLKVVDVLKNPELAVAHRVVTTPTLIRMSPKPVRRVVGDFNDIQRVLDIITRF